MAQRHVLMMLAAAATSFLEGESDRTETGSAQAIRIDADRRRRTRADASIRKTRVAKTSVVTGAAEKLAFRNAGQWGLAFRVDINQ